MGTEAFHPQLEQAQQALETALDEACGVDLGQVNTDELIRIEETLAMATKAAKQVVSVRLRLRSQRSRKQAQTQPKASPPADVSPRAAQRIFDDIRGKRWRVFAVHPSAATVERVALPEAFLKGWLSFEANDETRRVAPIPEGWEEISIEELRVLCHQAAARTPKRAGASEPPHDPKSRGGAPQ